MLPEKGLPVEPSEPGAFPSPEPGTWIEYELDGSIKRDLIDNATCQRGMWWAHLQHANATAFAWSPQYVLGIYRGGECLWRRA